MAKTFAKWREETPKDFCFSAKLPRSVTHFGKLQKNFDEIEEFFVRVGELGEKFFGTLVQLPPSLQYNEEIFGTFIETMRKKYSGKIFLEPRHPSWKECDFSVFNVLPVVSDPSFVELEPGDPAYFRLHGSPKLYHSSYQENFLQELATKLKFYKEAVVVFNNTASGAAIQNALQLMEIVRETQ